MAKKTNIILHACLALLLLMPATQLRAQEDWPHYSRDWNDPLFLARVQGMYDWTLSGPGNLSIMDYFTYVDGLKRKPERKSVHFYRTTTVNRDLNSFPRRIEIDPEAKFFEPPKDWTDRERLIRNMSDSGGVEEGFFEDVLNEEAVPDTYFLAGNMYFLQSNFAEAAENYQEAIQRFPNFKLAHQNLAYSQLILGDCTQALESASRAIELGAMSARIKGLQAYCALQENKTQTAVEAIEFARLLQPQNKNWQNLEIQALVEAGKHDQATKLLEAHLSGSALSEFHLSGLASVYRQQDNHEALMTSLEISRRAGLLSASQLLELNQLKISSGLAHLVSREELTEYASDSATDGEQLQRLLNSLGDTASVEFSRSVIDQLDKPLAPSENAALLISQAQALLSTGETELALSNIERAMTIEPNACEALILSAEIYTEMEQYAQADSRLERIERVSSDCYNSTLSRMAQLHFNRGSYRRSLELFQLDNRQKSITGIRPDRWNRIFMRELSNLAQMTSN